jgi:wobble nucleotide-excising tRNase
MICQSLISWLHDGSHATGLFDSLDYSIAGASPTQYLSVFERVFRETGNGDHFDLMMGVVPAVA